MYNSGNYLDINEIERLLPDSFLPLKKVDRKSVYKAGKDDLLAIVNSKIFSEPTGDYLWSGVFLDYLKSLKVNYVCHTVGKIGILMIPFEVLIRYAEYANYRLNDGERRYFIRIRIEGEKYLLYSKGYELDISEYFIPSDDDSYIDVINEQNRDWILSAARSFKDFEEQYVIVHSIKVRHESRCQKERIATLENHTCQICGFHQQYTNAVGKQRWIIEVDHIIPKSEGGGETIDNLLVLCPNCHAKKTAGIIEVNSDYSYKEDGVKKSLLNDNHLKV